MGLSIVIVVKLLLLNGLFQLSETVQPDGENDCGYIKIENPNLLFFDRNVTIKFTPNQTLNQLNTTPEIINLNNRPFNFELRLNNTEQNAFIFVLINCSTNLQHNDFYVKYGRCGSISVRLYLKELKNCGYLYLRTPCVMEGGHAEIVYIPAPAVAGFTRDYGLYWLEKRTESNEERISPHIPVKYEQRNESDSTYALIINDVDHSMDGYMYRVQCTKDRPAPDTKYTDPVTVNIFHPPDTPVLGPLQDIDDCKGCLVFLNDKDIWSKIHCKTTEKKNPNVSIEINGRTYQAIMYTNDMYRPMVSYTVYGRDHLTNVTCSVINCAIQEPLVASTQLYVAIKPGDPVLNVPVVYQGIPPNITCTSKGGRPKSTLSFYLQGDVISSMQTDRFNDETRTYESTATVTAVADKSWGGKEVICVQRQGHNISERVSYKLPVELMYPPSEVSVQLDKSSFTKQSNWYIVDVTCKSIKTNVPCNMTWSPTKDDPIYLRPPRKIDTERNTTYKAQLNATLQMHGRKITCTVNCGRFEPVSAFEVVYIPYSSTPLINTTHLTIIKEGSSHEVMCDADSYPPPNITWSYMQDGREYYNSCYGAIKCPVLVSGLQYGQQREYMCRVAHTFGTLNASFIAKGERSTMQSTENRPSSTMLVVAIVVSCLVVAGIIVVAILCIKRKRRSRAPGTNRRNEVPQMNDLRDDHNDFAVEYAVVLKASVKKTPTQVSPSTKRKSSETNDSTEGQLVYVELDTELLEANTSSASRAKPRQDEAIEYVDIDFAKKANVPPDDNIYANQ